MDKKIGPITCNKCGKMIRCSSCNYPIWAEEEPVLKFKKIHSDAIIPKTAHEGDAGYDLVASEDPRIIKDNNENILYLEYHTGLIVEPPTGFRTEIYPRSSIRKYHLSLANHIGLLDTTYRGEIICCFKISCPSEKYIIDDYNIYKKGDKIAQLVIKKDYIFPVKEVKEVSETERGERAFGSTDK